MKNRKIPFGYTINDGTHAIHQEEAQTIKRIYTEYIGGASLNDIAATLTAEKREYLPGQYIWNKNRISRILSDSRYCGAVESFPAVVSRSEFNRASVIKSGKYTAAATSIKTEVNPLKGTVHCAECGNIMRRRFDNRYKQSTERWKCSCGNIVSVSDEDLLGMVTEALNQIICDTKIIEDTKDTATPQSVELTRMTNEINRQLDSRNIDIEKLKTAILECAAKKYSEIKSTRHITDRLKADFEKSGPLSDFSPDLFRRTVSRILLSKNRLVQIVLQNQQIIGKEYKDE